MIEIPPWPCRRLPLPDMSRFAMCRQRRPCQELYGYVEELSWCIWKKGKTPSKSSWPIPSPMRFRRIMHGRNGSKMLRLRHMSLSYGLLKRAVIPPDFSDRWHWKSDFKKLFVLRKYQSNLLTETIIYPPFFYWLFCSKMMQIRLHFNQKMLF